jgi:uncharacterized protein
MQFHVNIEEIREKGLEVKRELPLEFLQSVLGGGSDLTFHAVGMGAFSGHFTKLTGRILLDGHIDVTLKSPCKRCLTDVTRANPIDFALTWVPAKPEVGRALQKEMDSEPKDDGAEEANGSFDLTAADTETYQGKSIDLEPTLREQILLNMPMDVVCKESCKGLCIMCGQDLNAKDCGHKQKVPDPRWAALKDIKLPN